jgi:integrase
MMCWRRPQPEPLSAAKIGSAGTGRRSTLPTIPYVIRRGARYSYRRRLPVPFAYYRPITCSLGTSDPIAARRKAARLSVCWERLVLTYKGRTDLTAAEAHEIFQDALGRELVRALEPRLAPDGTVTDKVRHNQVMAGLYRWAQLPADELLNRQANPNFTFPCTDPNLAPKESPFPLLYAHALELRVEVEQECAAALERVGVPPNPATLAQSLLHRLRGRAAAHDRAQLAEDPRIRSREDILGALLDEALIDAVRNGMPARVQQDPAGPPASQRVYLEEDTRRFTEVIDEVCAALQAENSWNSDLSQRQRIMKSFAWFTGDKRLCDYRPSDIARYKRALVNLPNNFKWGDYAHLPAAEVLLAFPSRPEQNRRSDRTINRDLSTMSKVAGELSKTAWKPAAAVGSIMNFAEQFNSVVESDDEPDRMPWTEAHLRVFFSSPIYHGGGGCGRRLKPAPAPRVWHDATYWVPLIAAYSYMSREEICGLEIADVLIDASVPFFAVRKNMTKSLDGITKAGLKTKNRNRVVPIHPELLRLGLAAYVASIAAEGRESLFPELYRPDLSTRGGKRFWASSFRYQVDAVTMELELPVTSKGKEADFHSFRTFGGSQFEASGTKQLTVDRILGHAPSGTGPRKYSRLRFTVEEKEYLEGLRSTLVSVAPVVTAGVNPQPVRHLRLDDRSRTGSAPGRRASLSKAARLDRIGGLMPATD